MADPEFWGALARGMQQRLQLLEAAADGNLAAFKRIASALDCGKGRIREAVETATDDHGAGALHIAALHGRTGVCAYLVEELHMDVNAAVSKTGDTPLSCAVRSSNKVDAARYLLDHGADPNKPVCFGCTALHIAVGKGICVMVELLLSKGADINSLSNEMGTPLHVAAMENQGDAMKVLLDNNADYNKEWTTDPIIFTPLFTALKARSLSCVKHLIKAGADVTKGGLGKYTPLIFAASEGLTDFYECLVEAGADPNAPDDCGYLPIEIAAFYYRPKDVEILLRLTSRIPSVHDWSVDGVLAYVKSILSDQDDPVYKMNQADLKLEANKAYKRKDYYTAEKLYNMAIMNADSAGDATLFSNRSMCYIKLGDAEKALRDAEACWNMDPHWPKACYRKGAAYMLLKDYEKARDAFLDGMKLDPTNAEMENALNEALDALKISRATTKLSELSLAQKNIMQD